MARAHEHERYGDGGLGPLVQGGSEEAIRENIARLIREGKSPEEASAIAHRLARENDRCYGTGACLACGAPLRR